MHTKKPFLFLLFLPVGLCAVSPVVSRFIPQLTTPELPMYIASRPTITVGVSGAHATKAFNKDLVLGQFMHSFDGLLELTGSYDLQGLIKAGTEVLPGYLTPFIREKTGGDAWANHEMYFAARSSLAVYGVHLGIHLPFRYGVSWGVQVPFWHMEARQQYEYPITQDSQTISLSDAEQVRRFRRYVHQDFGLQPGDWQQQSVGDVTTYIQWARSWQYVWLLRSVMFGLRTAVSAPTGVRVDTAYPSSVPAGNDGHWASTLSLLPSFELREGLRLSIPLSLTGMLAHTAQRRIATYAEPHVFSPLTGNVRVSPGATIRVAPHITIEHLIENLHFSIGYAWTKHWKDTWQDKRASTVIPSYLSRTSLPTPITGQTAAEQKGKVDYNVRDKHTRTAWHRSHVTFDVRYEMNDLFPRAKNVPQLRLFFDYCISGNRAARMSQIGAHFSWQF